MIWQTIAAFITSISFGAVSAIVPVINAEAYVVASQLSVRAAAIPMAVAVGVGQTLGKLLLFLGVRRGKNFRFVRHQREKIRAAKVGPVRQKFRTVVAALLRLVGTKRWGLPIVLLAAVTGLPPLYAVALLAGATKMRIRWFVAMVLSGRVARFVLVALGVVGLHHL